MIVNEEKRKVKVIEEKGKGRVMREKRKRIDMGIVGEQRRKRTGVNELGALNTIIGSVPQPKLIQQ